MSSSKMSFEDVCALVKRGAVFYIADARLCFPTVHETGGVIFLAGAQLEDLKGYSVPGSEEIIPF